MSESISNSVFISHSHSDRSVAQHLAVLLRNRGVAVFGDDSEVRAGDPWLDTVERALSDASAYVVLVSPSYQHSNWAHFESGVAAGRAAHDKGISLIPVVMPGATWADVPAPLRPWRGIDATHSTQEELAATLAEALQPLRKTA